MREIKEIIIHCSDSETATGNDVLAWHINGNGWDDVGYHYIIEKSGELKAGRPLQIQGAHCLGHNRKSIGICLIGRDKFSFEQLEQLRRLIYNIELLVNSMIKLEIKAHYEYNESKTCPNIDADLLREYLKCEKYKRREEIYKKMGV